MLYVCVCQVSWRWLDVLTTRRAVSIAWLWPMMTLHSWSLSMCWTWMMRLHSSLRVSIMSSSQNTAHSTPSSYSSLLRTLTVAMVTDITTSDVSLSAIHCYIDHMSARSHLSLSLSISPPYLSISVKNVFETSSHSAVGVVSSKKVLFHIKYYDRSIWRHGRLATSSWPPAMTSASLLYRWVETVTHRPKLLTVARWHYKLDVN